MKYFNDKFSATIKDVLNGTKFESGKFYSIHISIKLGAVETIKIAVFDSLPDTIFHQADKPYLITNDFIGGGVTEYTTIIPASTIRTEFNLRVENAIVKSLSEYTVMLGKIITMCRQCSENLPIEYDYPIFQSNEIAISSGLAHGSLYRKVKDGELFIVK